MKLTPTWTSPHWNRKSLLAISHDWFYELTQHQIAELERALRHLIATHKGPLQCTPADFPLPTLHTVLQHALVECEHGCGLFLIRGIPVANKPLPLARLLAWGIGLHRGVPLIQNETEALLVEVRNKDNLSPQNIRGHNTSSEMEFHVDACDLVTLLCLSKAAEGGRSKGVSSLTIHHHLSTQYPLECRALSLPLPFIDVSKTEIGEPGFFMCPVFTRMPDAFSCRFYRKRILATQELSHTPKINPLTLKALDHFQRIAGDADLNVEMDLQPGDLQCLNNHVVCHARAAFRDGSKPSKQRHLLRQWLATAVSRPLPKSHAYAYGSIKAGSLRGGYQGWAISPDIKTFQERLAHYNQITV